MVGHDNLRGISPPEGFHYSSPEQRTPFPFQKVPWEPLVCSGSPRECGFRGAHIPSFLPQCLSYVSLSNHLLWYFQSVLLGRDSVRMKILI